MTDHFFTPPTLTDLMENLRERDAAFKGARHALNEAQRAQLNAKLRFDAAKTGLECAELAVVNYMRKHGTEAVSS